MASANQRRLIDLLIADETPMNCQLLRGVFRNHSSCRVVGCAVSRQEILVAVNSHNVDILLINESLQDGPLTGFQVLSELRTSFPKTQVIMLLKSDSEDLVVDAFRGGARGIFCRAQPLHLIRKCINAVYEGQIWVNTGQLNCILKAFAGASPLRIASSRTAILTKREKGVIQLVVEGYTNRQVAEKLDLAEHTVSNYLVRIYEKLGISSRVELVLYSLRQS